MDINEFESSDMLRDFPEALRRYLGLESLESIVFASNARGATRLFSCSSFEPIEAITILYLDDKVIVSQAISDNDIWERIACGDEIPLDSREASTVQSLAASDLPVQFQTWELVVDSLADVESCMSDNPNEISYCHIAYGERVDSSVGWLNPTKAANPCQCAIIEAYLQIKHLL